MILCSMPVWDVLATKDAGCLMSAWPIFLMLFACPYPLWIVVVRSVIISAFAITSDVLFFPSEHQKVCRSCV